MKFLRRNFVGILTLMVVFAAVRYVVATYRQPGAMTVVEAQAMDMSQSGTPLGAAPVAIEKVSERTFAPTVTYTGSVAAFNDIEIYPRVTGTLVAVYAYPGQKVRAGQVVARLDTAELTSRMDEAAAARAAAEHDMNSSEQERQQALAQTRAAEAKAQAMRGALRDAKSQVVAARAMRDQAQREQEAAQAGLADADAGVAAMQADADYWRDEIAREEKLLKAGVVSREEYERERSQARAAEAKIAQARAAVREKQAMVAAAQARARQADAAIASAQAKADQAAADVQGALADIGTARATVALNEHHVAHRSAMAAEAEAQERTAAIVRGYTEIRAPQDGTVSDRLVSPGTLVQPGMAILRVKSAGAVRLQANVAESDLAGIGVGAAVTITSPRDPSLRIRTRVTSVFGAANAQTRTVTVEALTPNRGGRLVPGQYVVMELATAAPRTVITVPNSAIRRDEDQKPYVWTAISGGAPGKPDYTCIMHPEVHSEKPGACPKCGMGLVPSKKGGKLVAHRTPVTTGATDGRRTVIESGLCRGDQVLYRGHDNLNEGDPITPTEWDASGPRALPPSDGAAPSHSTADHSTMPGMKAVPSVPSMPSMPGMDGGAAR